MLHRTSMIAALAASMGLLAGSIPAAAQAGGNAQLLWGTDFHDASVGNATADGRMTTLTLEHFGAWALGDHFFFVDLTTGTFDAVAGRGYQMYSEWTPRLSLGRLAGRQLRLGPVSDLLLVGEVHGATGGYAAALIGPGVNLDLPGFDFLSLSLLRRDDSFNPATWQTSAVWSIPLPLVEGRFTGFMDVVGSPSGDPTVMTQPQLLIEVGPLVGTARRDLQVGVEWYLHSDGATWHSAPQALVRWAW